MTNSNDEASAQKGPERRTASQSTEKPLATDGGNPIGFAKLKPHPTELASAITGDHVATFGYGPDTNYQFEISGETDADDLEIDWTVIDLSAEDVDAILDGETYTEQCEDLAGKEYELQVRGGHRHPKGTPIHTEGDADD